MARSRRGIFWGAAGTVVVLDFITKLAAEATLQPPHVPHPILGSYVRFTLAYNPGAAFGMSLGIASRFVFGGVAVLALVLLWRLQQTAQPDERAKILGAGLAWGGAAGNLLDRLRSGTGVVDFIDVGVHTVRFWTFNVADSAVTVGAFVLAWALLQEDRKAAAAGD